MVLVNSEVDCEAWLGMIDSGFGILYTTAREKMCANVAVLYLFLTQPC